MSRKAAIHGTGKEVWVPRPHSKLKAPGSTIVIPRTTAQAQAGILSSVAAVPWPVEVCASETVIDESFQKAWISPKNDEFTKSAMI